MTSLLGEWQPWPVAGGRQRVSAARGQPIRAAFTPTADIVSDSSQRQCGGKLSPDSLGFFFFLFPCSPHPFFFFFRRALLKSVKLIHFLTKLKCFVLPAESLVTLRGPPSSQNELMDPLGRAECLPPLPPLLSDTVNLNQFQSLIIITNPSTVHLLLYNSNTAHDWVSARGAGRLWRQA